MTDQATVRVRAHSDGSLCLIGDRVIYVNQAELRSGKEPAYGVDDLISKLETCRPTVSGQGSFMYLGKEADTQ